jgi:hypothetical protein
MAGEKRGMTLAVGPPGLHSTKSATTKASSISGMGLAPLSDPYVAIHLTADDKKGSTDVVKDQPNSQSRTLHWPTHPQRLPRTP